MKKELIEVITQLEKVLELSDHTCDLLADCGHESNAPSFINIAVNELLDIFKKELGPKGIRAIVETDNLEAAYTVELFDDRTGSWYAVFETEKRDQAEKVAKDLNAGLDYHQKNFQRLNNE